MLGFGDSVKWLPENSCDWLTGPTWLADDGCLVEFKTESVPLPPPPLPAKMCCMLRRYLPPSQADVLMLLKFRVGFCSGVICELPLMPAICGMPPAVWLGVPTSSCFRSRFTTGNGSFSAATKEAPQT